MSLQAEKASSARYLLIRIHDFADAPCIPMFLIFLDWKEAFGCINDKMVISALESMSLASQIIFIIELLYERRLFRV